jgi:hypothetical protein
VDIAMINGVDRRGFLRTLGAAALASSAASTLRARGAEAQATSRGFAIREDRFGRMFPGLDPFFRENSSRLRAAMQDIGKVGGILDARDQLGDGGEAAAIALIADPDLNRNNPNNPAQTAGSTFMGQFFDHDVTFDLTSRLAVVAEPARWTSWPAIACRPKRCSSGRASSRPGTTSG